MGQGIDWLCMEIFTPLAHCAGSEHAGVERIGGGDANGLEQLCGSGDSTCTTALPVFEVQSRHVAHIL